MSFTDQLTYAATGIADLLAADIVLGWWAFSHFWAVILAVGVGAAVWQRFHKRRKSL